MMVAPIMGWASVQRSLLLFFLDFFQIPSDQSQQVGGGLVAGREASVERLQVAPADRPFDVLR